MPNEAKQLELRSGTVALGSTNVLHDIDFEMSRGEFVVLLGENGSGKTTLVRTLLGLTKPSRGTLNLFGTPIAKFKQWQRIGYVPQRSSAVSGVPATALEVALSGRIARSRPLRRYGRADREAAVDALSVVGMEQRGRDQVSTLSIGQQQRVLIARALAGDPELLVLDEPISGVDLEHQATFATTLGALKHKRRSVLLVAHTLGVLEPLATRAVVLSGGRITYDGPAQKHLHDSHVHHHPESIGGLDPLGAAGGRRT